MFTGLIQTLGKITSLEQDRFILSCPRESSQLLWQDLEIGDSVAVDGVCLTVEEILGDGFVATASPETLKRTTLGKAHQTASWVNLETSMRVGSKLGGHFVTGHVDGLGCLMESMQADKSWEMCFAAPPALESQWQENIARYLIPKGSIAVNGISLTVSDCDRAGSWFKVAVIPHSYEQTNLAALKVGNLVNLEGDILGKYVDKLLSYGDSTKGQTEEISLSFLTENGY
ncbi:MAG: riboflavin synthase [Spirulinaceae cyanobacterium]